MMAVGFEVQEEKYVLVASAEAWSHLVECKRIVEQTVQEYKRSRERSAPFGVNNASSMGGGAAAATTASSMPNFGGLPGMGAGGMPGMGGPSSMPDMAAAMNHMRQNPEQVRAMMQNPMVAQMLRNDPRMANNPMMQQGLEMMLNNPQMMDEAIRMMTNPSAMQRMQQQMADGGMGMGVPPLNNANGANDNTGINFAEQMQVIQQLMGANTGTGTGMGNMGNSSTQGGSASGNNNTANAGNGGDEGMTEEEMIEEAIRRSLRDNNNN